MPRFGTPSQRGCLLGRTGNPLGRMMPEDALPRADAGYETAMSGQIEIKAGTQVRHTEHTQKPHRYWCGEPTRPARLDDPTRRVPSVLPRRLRGCHRT